MKRKKERKSIFLKKLTSIKQMWIFISQSLAGDEEVSVGVEGQEGHHVVLAVVPDGSVRVWVLSRRWSVPPQPLLVKAFIEEEDNVKRMCTFTQIIECVCVCVCHLSTKAWWRRNMGSLAEPCTEDMDPFMNTCRAACMPLWELFPIPVRGSPNPGKWCHELWERRRAARGVQDNGSLLLWNEILSQKMFI